jgi:4a-hydroxytetrahydrobiopterin dehydratase
MSEPIPQGWQAQQKSTLLTRRFEFADYTATRDFLDRLAQLSEKTGYYPDLNFAKTHVNVSLAARGDSLDSTDYRFAGEVAELALALGDSKERQ